MIKKRADSICRQRGEADAPCTPRVFTVSSERKEGFPGNFPRFHEQFPAPLNPIIAGLVASRPTSRWLMECGKPSKNPRRSPNKGGWRGQGRCPSTWRTTGETGSRQENRVKSPFSRARRRGYVDTALAHPYILLFDPTATPVTFNGHWRLSQRVPQTHVHPEGSHRFHRLTGAQCPLEEAWSGR